MGQVAGRLALRVGLKRADEKIKEHPRLYCTVPAASRGLETLTFSAHY
jgi:hypothetical protein